MLHFMFQILRDFNLSSLVLECSIDRCIGMHQVCRPRGLTLRHDSHRYSVYHRVLYSCLIMINTVLKCLDKFPIANISYFLFSSSEISTSDMPFIMQLSGPISHVFLLQFLMSFLYASPSPPTTAIILSYYSRRSTKHGPSLRLDNLARSLIKSHPLFRYGYSL